MGYNNNFDKMRGSSRVVLNTAVVYLQLLVNAIIAFFTTRFVLQALGEEDFGIYTLVAGIVTMLSVLNSSMSNTAMRYMGHSLGEGNIENMRKTFNTTMFIHFVLGGAMIVVLEVGGWIMFEYFLNIPESKLYAAKIVYHFMIITTFISIISVPFDAVINAHENLLFLSLMNIVEGILKLALALYMLSCTTELLIQYGFFIMVIGIIMRVIKQVYCARKYKEVTLKFKLYRDKALTRSILSFTGWELFASVAAVCQGQLRSLLMNMFFGVRLNTAEGIGNRVNAQVNMVSIGVTRAITPQMNKAEGSGDRAKMLYLGMVGVKFTTFIFALLAVPLALEAKFLLDIWLDVVPQYTVIICQFCLAAQLLDKFTWQIGNAIRAAGRIRDYQIASGIIPIIGIIVSYFVYKAGNGPISIYVVNIIMLSVLALCRLIFGKLLLKMSPVNFIKNTTIPVLIPMLIAYGAAYLCHSIMDEGWGRMACVFSIFMSVYALLFYFFGINKSEREIINGIGSKVFSKIDIRRYKNKNIY